MAHSYHHAVSSAKRYGGAPDDYVAIHNWFDESKAFMADVRHRALRHHAEGIFAAERIFGVTLTNSAGTEVPTRLIGEQHVMEDMGWIPSVNDWFSHIEVQPWMNAKQSKRVRVLLDGPTDERLCRCGEPATDGDDCWRCVSVEDQRYRDQH